MEQLTDYTINGECSGCGRCCTNILPLSQKEIQKIKSYIGQYKVTPVNRNNVLTKEYSNVCPFLSKENKCNIYKVRPEICKRFICSKFKNNVKNKINTEPPPSPKPVNIPAKIPIIISNISCLPPFYSLLEKHYLYTRIN